MSKETAKRILQEEIDRLIYDLVVIVEDIDLINKRLERISPATIDILDLPVEDLARIAKLLFSWKVAALLKHVDSPHLEMKIGDNGLLELHIQ